MASLSAFRAVRTLAAFVVGFAFVGLAGCAGPDLHRYYTPETTVAFPRTENVVVVDGGTDAEAVYARLYRSSGYARLGYLSFVGPWEDDPAMVDFAKGIGADVTIISRRYVDSRVIDNPPEPPSSSSGMGGPSRNIYGGSEPGFDPAFRPTTQAYGPSSYVVRDYRQVAIFLRRVSP